MRDRTTMPKQRDARKKAATFALLRRVATGIERLFAPYCEVVIHDFSDLEHSIVDVQGSLCDRSVGGAATDLILKRLRGSETAPDLHCYRTELPNGRSLKSSTIFLDNDRGEVYGAFCVNLDISASVSLHRVLSALVSTETEGGVSEALTDDINETIGAMITETISEMGASGPFLGRNDKIALIEKLDHKGVFQVKKAISILAAQVGCSKATVYNYLREARSKTAKGETPNGAL